MTDTAQEVTHTSLEELGPVDYLVVEFPVGASNFTGEMAKRGVTRSLTNVECLQYVQGPCP